MKRVFVASSRKFYDKVKVLKSRLDELGVVGFYPYFDFADDSVEKDEKLKKELTKKHFPEIDQVDVLYILAEGGYTGVSVAIEASYAYAKNIEVISSEPVRELALQAIVSRVMTQVEFINFTLEK